MKQPTLEISDAWLGIAPSDYLEIRCKGCDKVIGSVMDGDEIGYVWNLYMNHKEECHIKEEGG